MVSLENKTKFNDKNPLYLFYLKGRKKETSIKFLYIIKNPKKIITRFTTNPDVAENASRCGLTVTCKSIKSRILK
jgi:hypothetical protein